MGLTKMCLVNDGAKKDVFRTSLPFLPTHTKHREHITWQRNTTAVATWLRFKSKELDLTLATGT